MVVQEDARIDELLWAGRQAYGQGDRLRAMDCWRQAAALRPDDERIWLELLSVVEESEDRRVCLENILTINPANEQARRQLRAYYLLRGEQPPEPRSPVTSVLLYLGGTLGRFIVLVLFIAVLFIIGLLLGVLINLL
jgi:hypothetical protein